MSSDTTVSAQAVPVNEDIEMDQGSIYGEITEIDRPSTKKPQLQPEPLTANMDATKDSDDIQDTESEVGPVAKGFEATGNDNDTMALDTEDNGLDDLQKGLVTGEVGQGYQPTAEELEAAQLFDQANNEEVEPRELSELERADAELAMLLHTQFESGYTSDNDRPVAPTIYECACGDAFTEHHIAQMVILNCGCPRCNDCLNQNVAIGLEFKRNYPPRCCGIGIEVDLIQEHLTEENIIRWIEIKDEFEDRAPIYCAIKSCSVHLTRDTLDKDQKWALCPRCNIRTCSGCSHLESDHTDPNSCPEHIDKLDRELFDKKKWKPCPGCKLMVEKMEGCDHMICDCDTEFCYRCGVEYVGGMPCNCTGQREWVEDEPEGNDPAMQQQIMERITGEAGEEHEAEHAIIDVPRLPWPTNADWVPGFNPATIPWHGMQDWGVGQRVGGDETNQNGSGQQGADTDGVNGDVDEHGNPHVPGGG